MAASRAAPGVGIAQWPLLQGKHLSRVFVATLGQGLIVAGLLPARLHADALRRKASPCSGGSTRSAGIATVTIVPIPGQLAMESDPPCSSASARAKGSPSPVP